MKKILISTNMYKGSEFGQILPYLKRFPGQVGVEVFPMFHEECFEKNLRDAMPLLKEVPVSFHGPYYQAEHSAAEGTVEYARTMELLEKTLSYAKELSSKYLVYHHNNCRIIPGEKEDRVRVSCENYYTVKQLCEEAVKIHEMYHPTLVYVTHDQIEAMTVGDRIALMYRGKMEMLDTPSHVYNRPASVFCAKFIGSPSMNIVEAEYHNGALVIGKQKVELPGIWQRIAAQCPSGLLYAGVRPEHVMMSRTPQERSIEGVVRYVEDYGNRYGVYIQVEGDKNELIAIREGEIPQPGEKVYIHVETEKLHLFDRGTEKSLGYPEMVIRAQEKLAVPKLEKAIAQ